MGVYFKLLKDAKGVSVDMYYFIAHFAIAVYKKILGLPGKITTFDMLYKI